MKKDISNYIGNCLVCQPRNTYPWHQLVYFNLRNVQHKYGEEIFMDFVVGLSSYQANIVIFVVVGRFSKASHFGMLLTHFSSYKTTEVFTSMLYQHHGFSRSIISDRDTIFMSNSWRTLAKLQVPKTQKSSAFHRKTDGQTKIVNRFFNNTLELLFIKSQKLVENS